ncbi:RNA-dependent ATPase rok1 [Taxawa tesnikishii (nom. ined.)]|nr:RNA-dependent ATPase rok1 [Dothideales sp. JES 119]
MVYRKRGKKLAMNTGIKVTNMRKGMHLDPAKSEAQSESDKSTPPVKSDVLVSTPLTFLHAIEGLTAEDSSLSNIRYLILDEADVLLDPLFREQTLRIWNSLSRPDLRVSLWSATMGSSIEELARETIKKRQENLRKKVATSQDGATSGSLAAPLVRLIVGLKDSAVPNIDHQLIYAATEQGKLMGLRQLLHPTAAKDDPGPTLRAPFLVFTQTIERAVALHSELLYDIPPEAGGTSRIAVLHSGLSDTARDSVMTCLRRGEVWVLITTDLLSRGVDFQGINGVVNYDVPSSAAAYVHRVGRTGRAGRVGGVAVTFYTKEDIPYIKNVANIISASQKQRGGAEAGKGVQQWLLDSLPTPSKRDKQMLKKRGIEARRSGKAKDGKDSRKARISTKSGFERRLENNKRGAVAAQQVRKENGEGDEESGSEFGGFDD